MGKKNTSKSEKVAGKAKVSPDATSSSTQNIKNTTTATPHTVSNGTTAYPSANKFEDTINILKAALSRKDHQQKVEAAIQDAKGNRTAALTALKDKLPSQSLERLRIADSVIAAVGEKPEVAKAILSQPNIKTMGDVAALNVDKLTAVIAPDAKPDTEAYQQAKSQANAINNQSFVCEPLTVLQRMTQEGELPIADEKVRAGLNTFLQCIPAGTDIRITPIYKVLTADALKDVPGEQRPAVMDQAKALWRTLAVAPADAPNVPPILMKRNLTSAFRIGEKPESTFLKMCGQEMGESVARKVYTNAINTRIRNEHALVTMREAIRGTGLAAIDGKKTREERLTDANNSLAANDIQLDLDSLFGDMDYCECKECQSVYSASSYFVELLNFLRNNNLGPDPSTGDPNPEDNVNIHSGIVGTPLEKLFRRRPDLGNLELTCQNTNTLLPYIDLVNEVMESFVVYRGDYHADTNVPKQAKIDVWNVTDETSDELLAQPQHTNYLAYCILKNEAVYPFTLPFHQPIEAARLFLKFLGTSRYEVLDAFRAAHESVLNLSKVQQTISDGCGGQVQPPRIVNVEKTLKPEETLVREPSITKLHDEVLDRAVDAEFLGLTQEEYIILTKEAFWPKEYFDITQKTTFTVDQYRQNIGVKQSWEYYGYSTRDAMLDPNADPVTGKTGLSFVKNAFLRRTGLQYTDLVDLLETRFINPLYPKGLTLTILENIQSSYRFLQTLVNQDPNVTDPKIKFAKLIGFLETSQSWDSVPEVLQAFPPVGKVDVVTSRENPIIRRWVYCCFEKLGQLIVLDSGEGLQLPIEGELNLEKGGPAELCSDGTIVSASSGILLGTVSVDIEDDGQGHPTPYAGPVNWVSLPSGSHTIYIKDENGHIIGRIDSLGVWAFNLGSKQGTHVEWTSPKDTCDLNKVRLLHLDGSPVIPDEFDRVQRFIRLWHKLGWTIDEVDKALEGLATLKAVPALPVREIVTPHVDFKDLKDACRPPEDWTPCGGDGGTDGNPTCDISPDFLHQLVAVKKLLDLTGLPLIKLLTFWDDISTIGDKSLYVQLFLNHNMLAIDTVFQADNNGNYLTSSTNIRDHLPVLMAALKLKGDDITTVVGLIPGHDTARTTGVPDAPLTLSNVSFIYRHGLMARALGVRVSDLPDLRTLFGDPFKDADTTLSLFDTWQKMEDAGFTFRQLTYAIKNLDDPLKPLAWSQKTMLQTAKTIYDGLNAIDLANSDITDVSQATTDLVRTETGQIFDPGVVEQIVGLLEGTNVYTTNAPSGLQVTVPDSIPAGKLKYFDPKDDNGNSLGASIKVTGIFTNVEVTAAKAIILGNTDWSGAIDRVGKQAETFFNNAVTNIFCDSTKTDAENQNAVNDAKSNLLAGDVIVPADQMVDGRPDPNTAPGKRYYFLQHYLPFLRQRLEQRFITDTMSAAGGLANDVTNVLLSEVLLTGNSPQSAMTALQSIKVKPASGAGWKGYLIPPADDNYAFVAIADNQPLAVKINGQPVEFPNQQLDPSNVWSTNPVQLKAGTLYSLEITDPGTHPLQWRTSTSLAVQIPASALLPDDTTAGTTDVFREFSKAAIVVNDFELSVDEVRYFQEHRRDFDNFDFNLVTLAGWQRIAGYVALRGSLPKAGTPLLNLFAWCCQPDDASRLAGQIDSVTQWKEDRIKSLIAGSHFDLNRPAAFKNEVNLVKMQKAIAVADAVGVDIDSLFNWAVPGSKFAPCHSVAEDIRMAAHARFAVEEDWEQAIKPVNDQLREKQKEALISFLLVQPDLVAWPVADADSLFEFFLIDVQMGTDRETTRMVQAIASVQLFIKRCLMGLEDKTDINGNRIGVTSADIDRDRWEWMQKYRVWEANRQVFLYPENWIQPELRDDKSPFYEELESELLQKDINPQTVEDALKNYLYKVDEVANMQVVGLFVENGVDEDMARRGYGRDAEYPAKLHVFGRTRSAPYFFYYCYYDFVLKNWYPWEKMQVDIPSYDIEPCDEPIPQNGTYLIPVVLGKRLFVFFPQLVKKTKSSPPSNITAENDGNGNMTVSMTQASEYWEIKMAWSEYRNGKWTQKLVSGNIIQSPYPPRVHDFQFVPRIMNDANAMLAIDICHCYYTNTVSKIGTFKFSGSQISSNSPETIGSTVYQFTWFDSLFLSDESFEAHSYQAVGSDQPDLYERGVAPYFSDTLTSVTAKLDSVDGAIDFYLPFAHELISTLNTDDLKDLFNYYMTLNPNNKADAFGAYCNDGQASYHELKRPYSLYNWEVCFHAPMELVEHLLKSQQFDQALEACQYVFNPLAEPTDGEDVTKRCWQFPPFKEIEAKNVLQTMFNSLRPGQPDTQYGINEWRDNPFEPHVVARSRPSAYMKYVVMSYINILIQYGDYYFRQYTTESIPLAIQCYIMASHLYGPRGQTIPPRGKVENETYNSLLDKWDAFGNAMVEMELAFPFSNQTSMNVSSGGVGLANIFGSLSTLYFGIPDNPSLTNLRNTIDQRLFEIRSCENIEGIFQQVPPFDPPIDPALLVQAAAQGLSLSTVLNDMNSPMPNYRFYYLLQKALELCSELKSLGNAFLSAKEKGDAEALSNLRAKHESGIQNLVMEVRKQQLDEASKSLDALQQNREAPVSRMQYYLQLIGEDLSKVPDESTDFSELPNQLEQPIDDSGLKLISYEKEEMDKAGVARELQIAVGALETLSSILHVIPSFEAQAEPFGIGMSSVITSGWMLGNAAEAIAKGLQIGVSDLTYQSTNAGRKASFLRQLQDRIEQANAAGYEIKNIDKQILTQQIRIAMATQELTNQQQQIDDAQEVEDFLRNKYTNEELYSWMEGNIRTLYYQTYTLAYDLAKKAEKAYRFERGLSDSNFIQFGYWDAGHDGLMAGERLYLALKQLETAYQENRGYDFEITKHVSLRQLDPLALLNLRENASCEFDLPEVLFDMDYPGQYMRRIKSVALTVPCVVGPYTSLNCTLRLTKHTFRISSLCGQGYAAQTDGSETRFITTNVPITSIAVSSGQNDSGVFELNFHDERYIPFEGAGAISSWRIELPNDFRPFDYDTISDVIIHLRYTSVDGGDNLKVKAAKSADDIMSPNGDSSQQEGLFAFFDLKHDFPNEWSAFVNAKDNSPFSAAIRKDYFPYLAQGKQITINNLELYGQDVTKHHPVGDQGDATNALKDKNKLAYTITIPPDGAGPTQVLTRTADAQVFLIICYSLSDK